MWSAPIVEQVFFPLDERLGLLPTGYSPFLVEAMVRLGIRLPFAQVAEELALLFGVSVSPDTVRRLTEEAGAIQVAIEQGALERLEQEAPPEPAGPAVQQVSADGAMVHLVGGNWTEVRTTAIGTVVEQGEEVRATELSYFSRHCSAEQFIRQATLPTHERGTRGAAVVVSIMDGAPWLQELIDEQCPAAVRILDFAHAVGYLGKVAQAAFGAGSREAAVWLDEWASKLKRETPEEVIAAIRGLPAPTSEAKTVKRTVLRYLTTRLEQVRYATFQEQGYPIGSGIVRVPSGQDAGKRVVEARLKGSGMQWEARNLNPLLALRGRLCSGQWETIWPGITQAWRVQVVQHREERRLVRQATRAAERALHAPAPPPSAPKRERPKTIIDGRPTEEHPWKQRRRARAAA